MQYHTIKNISFFKMNNEKLRQNAFAPQNNILDQLIQQHNIELLNHPNEDFLANLVRLLRSNLTVVRFLLVLVDSTGNRLMPLSQPNLVTVCNAIAAHEVNLQINTDRLERLYYLCSQSKKFSGDVTSWMRMYGQHCAANDTPISFPELLLTYCANYPEHVDESRPLSLQTLCAKMVRNKIPRQQIPCAALALVDEESVLPNGIGDDQYVVALLSNLSDHPSQIGHLQLGM
ncbi:MAG: hypothetical protein M3R00_10230 [Pseudomonadota bacterium]|nr:hypothetical protein [Pseudomonadota bacterium]